MNELALFAGAGGGILGSVLLGWRTVAAIEIEDYSRAILLQRQADGILPRFPVWDDVRTFDGKPWRGRVDVITGGFPCQDISAAGKGAGITGERSGLWSEFSRIIDEVRPRYCFVENSPLLVSRGLDVVLSDLASLGYNAAWGVVGAWQVGAPHRRDRIWILGHSKSKRGKGREIHEGNKPKALSRRTTDSVISTDKRCKNVADGGQLSPTWTEWLMGWPLEWTDLRPLVTDKFRSWLQQHGISCIKDLHQPDTKK